MAINDILLQNAANNRISDVFPPEISSLSKEIVLTDQTIPTMATMAVAMADNNNSLNNRTGFLGMVMQTFHVIIVGKGVIMLEIAFKNVI